MRQAGGELVPGRLCLYAVGPLLHKYSMTNVFIIQNQNGLLLSKQGDWVDGVNAGQVYRTLYKDEAVNVKVELSVRDPGLRLRILSCAAPDKGQLQLAELDQVHQ